MSTQIQPWGLDVTKKFDLDSLEVSNTLTISTVSANGTVGSNGQVLTSNGTTVYWSSVSGGGGGDFDGSSITSDLIPAQDNTYNLGSISNRWKTLFVAGSTVVIGNVAISDSGTGTIQVAPVAANGQIGDPSPIVGGGGGTQTATIYQPGFLVVGNTGATRWYPARSLTINSIVGRVLTPGSSNVVVLINKNDSNVANLTIQPGVVSQTNVSISATANDFLTAIVADNGKVASDLYVSFVYTTV
jgi:hypothetical protein